MGIQWSDAQLNIINARNKDLLVSAAAGSGKTAVLVERIIRMITDRDNPVDVDQLLVVTFTKAAAGEMKNRISDALIEASNEQIEGESEEHKRWRLGNLQKQSALVTNAQITTIDSFCLFVMRNYFEEIGLDPDLRTADEVEMKLIQKDVLAATMNDNYERGEEAFLDLVKCYGTSKNDGNVRSMVEKLYNLSQSAPWPKLWLEDLIKDYEVNPNSDEVKGAEPLVTFSHSLMESLKMQAEYLHEFCQKDDAPTQYLPVIESDIAFLDKCLSLNTYKEFHDVVVLDKPSDAFKPLSTKKNEACNPNKLDTAKAIRTDYKNTFLTIADTYFAQSPEEVNAQMERLCPVVRELIRLTLEYSANLTAEKKRLRVIDFSDMEHYALDILVEPHRPGEPQIVKPVAKQLQKHFKEIMIDEYQDSNEVQEEILSAIAGESSGEYKMFMVGDVKQSIYKFRMAKPELFLSKYNGPFAYSSETHQKIDLSHNFRSRAGVLSFCNDIFFRIMKADIGGVEYTDEVALHVGDESAYPDNHEACAEVMLLDPESIPEDSEEDRVHLEALMVAHRIQELIENKMQVKDKASDGDAILRDIRYSDIVILCRSTKKFGPVLAEVFANHNIPMHVDSATGYFSANEIITILDFLRLIDNPLQDIPMASVLHSSLVGLDEEELAEIRVSYGENKKSFAAAALEYLKEQTDNRAAEFYQLLLEIRGRKDLMVHEIIELIFARTGYDMLMAALPGGEIRLANLNMLVQMAIKFEETSYKGVFHFLRYIEQMKKYEIDMGEADADGESGDKVHVKTIHKSKGLEFPVVFVCGMSSKFNTLDENGTMIVHTDYGIGIREVTGNPRVKKESIRREMIRYHLHQDELGEELRVLYVALTRAKEKLILTGLYKQEERENKTFTYADRANAKCYLDWLLPALDAYPYKYSVDYLDPSYISLKESAAEEIQREDQASQRLKISQADTALVSEIKKQLNYQYPYASDVSKKAKYSVSELKHQSMVENYDEREGGIAAAPMFASHEKESYIPTFIQKQEKGEMIPAGALYGTAVHRMMEVLNFAEFAGVNQEDSNAVKEFAKKEFRRMCDEKLLEDDLSARVNAQILESFLYSPVAKTMALADARNQLYREKPFVMEYEGGLLQGIIDVFWVEEDSITLLDYKTDKVDTEDELVLRYKKQLDLYGEALSKIFGTNYKVHKPIIYSFRFQEVIEV